MQKEEFKEAPWIICSNGTIISKKTGNIKKCSTNNSGYLMVNYKAKNYYVHRIIAETFLGNIEKGKVVNHIDGNKQNNNISNLEVVSYGRNEKHAYENDLKPKMNGQTNGMSKLNDEEAKMLIRDILAGARDSQLANTYNLHPRYVNLIRHKKRWKTMWRLVEEGATTMA